MPWISSQVDEFRKGLSRKQKKKWVAVANGALASCMEGGGSDKECAGRAVRIANSKFEFNPVLSGVEAEELVKKLNLTKKESELVKNESKVNENSCCEMEIFRSGTHNGDDFTEDNLEEIASNYHKLKNDLRPKLKITHRENQKTLAGLSSYGDIVDVFTKTNGDGKKCLYAKISNVPQMVLQWIKERRFPDRSIEIYPTFKLGTKENSPVYKNVLKAIALLGHEMPAVAGLEPIKLTENIDNQKTICFMESCMCEDWADTYLAMKQFEMDMKLTREVIKIGS